MKSRLLLLLGFGVVATALSFAEDNIKTVGGRVTVTYESPDKFTDFKTSSFGSDKDIDYLTGVFTQHLESLARQFLPAGARLEMRFKDIDLAGEFEPQRGPRADNVRFMRDIYAPRMKISFRLLAADGSVLSEGERKLSQQNYTMLVVTPADDALRYDKGLLTDWMRAEFGKK